MQGTHAALCRAVLSDLREQPQVGWFIEPVDVVAGGLTDYHDKIKQPMDLSTVSKKLSFNQYKRIDAFFKDVDLVFSNAITYNPHTHDCYKAARELRARFKERYRILLNQHDQIMMRSKESLMMDMEEKLQDCERELQLLKQAVKKRQLQQQHEAAAEKAERSLTLDEKQHLVFALGRLSSAGAQEMYSLIKKDKKDTPSRVQKQATHTHTHTQLLDSTQMQTSDDDDNDDDDDDDDDGRVGEYTVHLDQLPIHTLRAMQQLVSRYGADKRCF